VVLSTSAVGVAANLQHLRDEFEWVLQDQSWLDEDELLALCKHPGTLPLKLSACCCFQLLLSLFF
jgi:hypothetical protein